MSVIAEFDTSSPDSALADALSSGPDVELDVVQYQGIDPNRPYVFVWISGPDLESFERAMERDETVHEIERYTDLGGRRLYRMRITDETDIVGYPAWVSLGADMLECQWSDGKWRMRMRFPDRETTATIQEWCEEYGVRFTLRRIYSDDTQAPSRPALSPEQEEAIRIARDVGYFEIPREASMADLADELGVSSQAVSERLRRAHRALIDEYVRK